MKRKEIIMVITALAVLALPLSIYAATSNTPIPKAIRGFFGIDTSKLTDTQKSDVTDYSKKMGDLQKEFINKMVSNGSMTKEQGDAEIAKIDEAIKNGTVLGGMGRGGFKGKDGMNKGMNQIDISKLTAQQKADLTTTTNNIADLRKNLVNTMVSDGLMTKAQGDAATTHINSEITEDASANNVDIGEIEGFKLFGFGEFDSSKLTDKQKTDLTDYAKNMAVLQKELINKLVADSVLTKAQGNAEITEIDNAVKNGDILNGEGMGHRGFKGHGHDHGYDNSTATTTPTAGV